MKNGELLLQELDAVICNLLLHLAVEMWVLEWLVLSQLLSEFVAEFFAHLLWDNWDADKLLCEGSFLLASHLQAHIHFDLMFKLCSQVCYVLLLLNGFTIQIGELFLKVIPLNCGFL